MFWQAGPVWASLAEVVRSGYDGQVMWELRNQPDLLVLDCPTLDPILAALTADKFAALLETRYYDRRPALIVAESLAWQHLHILALPRL